MLAFPLSDGRLQIVVDGPDPHQRWTCWKTTTDPVSVWSDWAPLPTTDTLDSATTLPNGITQLFGTSGAGYTIGPFPRGITSAWKTSDRADAGWTDWVDFHRDADGGPLHHPHAATLADGRVLLVVRADEGLRTVVMGPGLGDVLVPTHPAPDGQSLMGLDSPVVSHALVAHGGGCLQLFAAAADHRVHTRWSVDGGDPQSWSPWRHLKTGARSVKAARLSDGRIQVWGTRAVRSPSLWTRWTLSAGNGEDWSDEVPFGVPSDLSGADIDDFCVGPLSDGRLQIVVRAGGGYFTCWKMVAAPDAPWSVWTGFDPPPR